MCSNGECTYDINTRADFRALLRPGNLAILGVPDREAAAPGGGGGAKGGTGDDDNGVGMSSSSSSISSKRRFLLVPFCISDSGLLPTARTVFEAAFTGLGCIIGAGMSIS